MRIFLSSFVALAFAALPALAGGLTVQDAYARAASPTAKAGAAFLIIENTGAADDALVAVTSDVAKRIELHTHIDAGDGVMQMREVEGGLPVPAGGTLMMKRGGDHVMMMGLTRPLAQGDVVTLTMTFESGATMTVDVPVDLERKDDHSAMTHSGHGSDS